VLLAFLSLKTNKGLAPTKWA
jgi:hypothetical protein